MSILKRVLSREEIRYENMIKSYSEELVSLPKGTITTKKINGRPYFYLNYRQGKKVVSKYIGKEEDVMIVQEKLARRKQIDEIIKKLKVERNQIIKMEAKL